MSFSVDLHTHTRFGSNCSYMEPAQLVQRAKEVGLDAVCITEHNAPWDEGAIRALSERSGFPVLGGVEVSTELGDVLVFGVQARLLAGSRMEDLRRLVETEGGVMIAAHPFRCYSWPGAAMDVEEAAALPVLRWVDAVEVFNGTSPWPEVEFGCAVLERLGLPGVGGSDAHSPLSVGRCYTRFEREVASVEELVAELKGGRFRAVHCGLGLER
jgi:predicted metal-dependent phosphoesterase TrpH